VADEIDLASFTAQPALYAKKYPRIDACSENERVSVQELNEMAAFYGDKAARLTETLYVQVPKCDEVTIRSMQEMCEQARA
jgi:hypothetical protein